MDTNSKSIKYWKIKLIKKRAKNDSIERKKLEDGIKKTKETICHYY
jgi:hypothetical protein